MVFSSVLFLFYFLPILLLLYYVVPNKYKNYVLLVGSLIFYYIGEPKNIIYLIISCLINYIVSILIHRYEKQSKLFLVLGVIYNVGALMYFKYTDFFIQNINNIFNSNFNLMHIIMPIGISFYTFQALSYIIDVYNKKHLPSKNILEFTTYLILFPQLIAGPIVRYRDVEGEIRERKHNTSDFASGIKRFIVGLAKKVLIANVLGECIKAFTTVTVINSWLKPIIYTLELYFDFSGYSDMAIGLGLMFGFHFLENFNYPLIASSITDFFRRWHMSLSYWFRDYIYIPLGGNRCSKLKQFRNIFIVWFLTGFWHGASWNFIIWGLYFGTILLIEKLILKKYLDRTKVLKYVYTIFIVIIGFLIFSTDNILDVFNSLKDMFYINNNPVIDKETIFYIKDYLCIILISIIGATPLVKNIYNKIKDSKVMNALEPIIFMLLLILSVAFIIDASFNPFLYFRF